MQRRHQKVIEEAPAPGIARKLIEKIGDRCVAAVKKMGYRGAGTFEFLFENGEFYFIEMNTRVQVEHPVTEMITGVDIVQEQIRVAYGEKLRLRQKDIQFRGHAIECRINAEDVSLDFRPTPGQITEWVEPSGAGIRVDTCAFPGAVIPPYYDSLIAKVITHSENRGSAIELMSRALNKLHVVGISTTADLHIDIMNHNYFRTTPITTKWLEESFLPDRSSHAH
jgi:acetyl-CoA carboxylase biotin carboxylase subunit